MDTSRPTTVKTRVISGGQHVVRVDEESTEDVTSAVGQDVLNTFKALLEGANRPDVVILEDYDKGLLTEDTVSGLLAACKHAGIASGRGPQTQALPSVPRRGPLQAQFERAERRPWVDRTRAPSARRTWPRLWNGCKPTSDASV